MLVGLSAQFAEIVGRKCVVDEPGPYSCVSVIGQYRDMPNLGCSRVHELETDRTDHGAAKPGTHESPVRVMTVRLDDLVSLGLPDLRRVVQGEDDLSEFL